MREGNTRDVFKGIRVMKAIRAGILWLNAYHPTYNEAPWGGYKQSGFGREGGRAGIEEFVRRGGSIVATHETSLCDESGTRRENFGLAALFGVDFGGKVEPRMQNAYLRLEHDAVPRHPLLRGLDRDGVNGVDAPVVGSPNRVFNFAYNPSCVYSPAYDCPYPLAQNRLAIPIPAGEKLPYDPQPSAT